MFSFDGDDLGQILHTWLDLTVSAGEQHPLSLVDIPTDESEWEHEIER